MDCERLNRLLSSIQFQAECAKNAIGNADSATCYTMLKSIRGTADLIQDEIASATIPKTQGANHVQTKAT